MKLSSLLDPRLVHLRADVDSIDQAIELGLKSIVELYGHELGYEDVMIYLAA